MSETKAEAQNLDLLASSPGEVAQALPAASPVAGLEKSESIPKLAEDVPILSAGPMHPVWLKANDISGPLPLKLLAKLCAIMGDLAWVEKRGENKDQNYTYATEADILGEVRPKLAAAGIYVRTILREEKRIITGINGNDNSPIILCRVETLHTFCDTASGEAMDVIGIGFAREMKDDKAFYKAYTGSIKYAFTKEFLLSTGDDPENETPEEKAAKKAAAKTKGTSADKPGPRTADGSPLPQEGVIFTVDGPVGEYSKGKTRENKPRFIFKLGGIGDASTVDEKLANYLMPKKGTGMRFRWSLIRSGSFINLKGAEPLDQPAP